MRPVKAILVLFLCTISFSAVALSEELTNQKKEAIRELIEITGAVNIGKQLSQAMIAEMTMMWKQSESDVPQKAFDILEEVVNSTIEEEMGSFVESCYPIYHKYLTLAEIRKMVEFYKTPVGKKVVETMPKMMQESMQASQQWVERIGNKVLHRLMVRLREEGIEIKK